MCDAEPDIGGVSDLPVGSRPTSMADDEPLFIVDNAPGGRTGVDYLSQWCKIAKSFDIATGYFDIGALLALDGDWQQLDGMRILMGDQVMPGTKKALLDAVCLRAARHLDSSIEEVKREDPFLGGADEIVAALGDGRIVCRVYNRDKFHAKAYITHGRLDIVGSQALVGSSNFTKPGLTQNVELNLNLESRLEVAQLQAWYERHWNDAADVTPEMLKTVQRHTVEHPPFDVYAKSLQTLVATNDPSSEHWEQHVSKVFPKLDRYQQEGYGSLMQIATQHEGAFLCDGVGLGKTFVGLMLIERLINDGKRVVLFAPRAVREAVWDKELRNHLSHVGSFGAVSGFNNLRVFNHTDLTRGGDFPDAFEAMAQQADVVIVDEAHHFRNRGPKQDPDDPGAWSRYHRLSELIQTGRPKQVFLLTATPINNSLSDFRNLIELFTGADADNAFSRTLGVPSVQARLNALTSEVKQHMGGDEVVDAPDALQETLSEDELFKGLVVQRSRAYVRASQEEEGGAKTRFPEPLPPKVAAYSLRKSHGALIELLDESFQKDQPLFSLSIYYPLAFYTGPDDSINPREMNRQKQVVGLIRTNFLKRFESSVRAFQQSCDRLLKKLLAFLKTYDEQTYDQWVRRHAVLLEFVPQLGFWDLTGDEEPEDVVSPELLEDVTRLEPLEHYDLNGIVKEVLLDLEQIAKLLEATRRFTEEDDDKLAKLVAIAKANEKANRKTLVFTEFADTARYLHKALIDRGLEAVGQLDGSSKVDRRDVIERFSPYYNGTSSVELLTLDRQEIRMLVTTDVLAEGLNLQDATHVVNYDIHWNPVRLMQRIGRVDRRLNPDVEARIVTDYPELEAERGKVVVHNFLPPDELELLLKLYERVAFKSLLISATLGIERSFLTPDDDFAALREFNEKFKGEVTALEHLQLEYQALLSADPELERRLDALPGAIFSGRAAGKPGTFLCYELPALDTQLGHFTLEAGTARWYLLAPDGQLTEDAPAIADVVRCEPATPRQVTSVKAELLKAKKAVEKHVKNSYLRSVDAPIDAPKPRLVAWLDVGA